MTEPIRGLYPIIDPMYRYQMTPINIVKERTKICITNLDQIAHELRLFNKEPIIAFINKRLSTKTKIVKGNIKGKPYDRVILGLNIDIQSIRESIYLFIETFILCPICRLPELSYQSKKPNLLAICCACSFRGEMKPYNNTSNRANNKHHLDIMLEREENDERRIHNAFDK